MSTLVVAPCGLSLLDAIRDEAGRAGPELVRLRAQHNQAHWRALRCIRPADPDGRGAVVDWLRNPVTGASLGKLREGLAGADDLSLRRLSAETATVWAAADLGAGGGGFDRGATEVLLLASDTPAGIEAACLVAVALAPSELSIEFFASEAPYPESSPEVQTLLDPSPSLNPRLGPCAIVVVPGLRVGGRPAGDGGLSDELARASRYVARRVALGLTDEELTRLCLLVTGGFKVLIPYLTTIAPFFGCVGAVDEVVALATHEEAGTADVAMVPLLQSEVRLARVLNLLDPSRFGSVEAHEALGGLALGRGPGGEPRLVGVGPALDELRRQMRPDLTKLGVERGLDSAR